jgi:hypothetical protein
VAGRVRIVWSLARVALLTVVALAGAGRGCGYSVRAMQGARGLRRVAATRRTEGEAPKLTIRVYNYARLNRALLGNAEQVASTLFGKAGVETAWVECPLSEAEYASYPGCHTKATPTDIDLKVLPRSMGEKLQMRSDLLGFVRPCSDSDAACEVTIFGYLVDELAADGYRADAILGHAIAHEMAHVLLGGAHTRDGIMRAEWKSSELQKMSWGILLSFSDTQSEALVSAAQRREMARDGLQEEAALARVDLARGAK